MNDLNVCSTYKQQINTVLCDTTLLVQQNGHIIYTKTTVAKFLRLAFIIINYNFTNIIQK